MTNSTTGQHSSPGTSGSSGSNRTSAAIIAGGIALALVAGGGGYLVGRGDGKNVVAQDTPATSAPDSTGDVTTDPGSVITDSSTYTPTTDPTTVAPPIGVATDMPEAEMRKALADYDKRNAAALASADLKAFKNVDAGAIMRFDVFTIGAQRAALKRDPKAPPIPVPKTTFLQAGFNGKDDRGEWFAAYVKFGSADRYNVYRRATPTSPWLMEHTFTAKPSPKADRGAALPSPTGVDSQVTEAAKRAVAWTEGKPLPGVKTDTTPSVEKAVRGLHPGATAVSYTCNPKPTESLAFGMNRNTSGLMGIINLDCTRTFTGSGMAYGYWDRLNTGQSGSFKKLECPVSLSYAYGDSGGGHTQMQLAGISQTGACKGS